MKYVKLVESVVSRKQNAIRKIKRSPEKDLIQMLSADNHIRGLLKIFIDEIRKNNGHKAIPKLVEIISIISLAMDD